MGQDARFSFILFFTVFSFSLVLGLFVIQASYAWHNYQVSQFFYYSEDILPKLDAIHTLLAGAENMLTAPLKRKNKGSVLGGDMTLNC